MHQFPFHTAWVTLVLGEFRLQLLDRGLALMLDRVRVVNGVAMAEDSCHDFDTWTVVGRAV